MHNVFYYVHNNTELLFDSNITIMKLIVNIIQ